MNPALRCPACGCCHPAGTTAHGVAAALLAGDLDLAMSAGLLEGEGCAGCSATCAATRIHAHDGRVTALAARQRYLDRNARLQRRMEERAAKRVPARRDDVDPAMTTRPSLPSAAAAALARAKAKAAGRRGS